MVLEHPGRISGKGSKKEVIRMICVGRLRPEVDIGLPQKTGAVLGATEQGHVVLVKPLLNEWVKGAVDEHPA